MSVRSDPRMRKLLMPNDEVPVERYLWKSTEWRAPGVDARKHVSMQLWHLPFNQVINTVPTPLAVKSRTTSNLPHFCFWRENRFFKISRNLFDLRDPEPQKALVHRKHYLVSKFHDCSFNGVTCSLL